MTVRPKLQQRAAALAGSLVVLGSTGLTRHATADAPPSSLHGSMSCEAPSAPGRLRCDVDVRVADGELRWAAVEVVTVADFILPLRGRLGPRESSTHETDIYRWSLGFVARDRGVGEVAVRVRAVVCRADACTPESVMVKGTVTVGR